MLRDHGLLRIFWTNFHEVAPGVWRSNQPSPGRMAAFKARGIDTVLNLRGENGYSYHLFEAEAAGKLGMTLVDFRLRARKLPSRERIHALHRLFLTLDRPFVMHCKSGADRSGFAAALYLLMVEKRPVAEAQQQLHWRFVHFSRGPTGILDHFLRAFAEAEARSGIGFMRWLDEEYDPEALTVSFQRWLAENRRWWQPRFLTDPHDETVQGAGADDETGDDPREESTR